MLMKHTNFYHQPFIRVSAVLVLFILLVPAFSFAQDLTQVIRGTVVDKESREPLIGATVQVLGGPDIIGTVTDIDGKFRISNVTLGRKTIKISYIGYDDAVLSDVIVNSAKEVVLHIELLEKVTKMEDVVIKAKANKAAPNNDLVLISGRVFTIDQANRYAGALADPSRMAANFAGVAGGGNDQRNDIIVRGNTTSGLLWRIEGADIFNPNHFSSQGSNAGGISILNNNTLSNSDFLTGAFPAEYGNAMAGVFDLKMRNGNNEKQEFIGQVGFNGIELLAEGPIKKNGASYLIAYRYSTFAFFGALGFKFGSNDVGIPYYQDITYKINLPKTKLGAFSIWGLGGMSSTEILDTEKDEAERKKLADPRNQYYSGKTGTAGITHSIMLGKTAYIKTTLYATGAEYRAQVDTISNNNQAFYLYNSDSKYGKAAVHSFINKKWNARHSFRYGFIGNRLFAYSNDSVWVSELNGYQSQFDFSEKAYQAQTYLNWNYRITNDLVLNTGLHYNYFFFNNTASLEPRASMRWSFTRRQSLSVGYGLHSQVQSLITYNEKTLIDTLNRSYIYTNRNLGMNKSHHFVLGYEKMFGEDIRLKVETYYQYLFNLPVAQSPNYFSSINTGSDYITPHVDSLVNNGVGRNYGVELTLERFFSKGYYYLITTSLYKSEYRASDQKWRSTAFDGNYIFNMLGGKEFALRKNRILSISIKVTYAGSRRYVPILEQESAKKGEAVYDEDKAFELRLKDFFRTDLKIGFKINGKRVTQEFALDLQNMFNTQNVLTKQFNPRSGKVENLYQIGIFPIPLYRIYF